MIIEQRAFPNYGYSISRLPDDAHLAVKQEIEDIQDRITTKEKISKNLAGHLENQFYLDKSKLILEPLINELAVNYILAWNYQHRIPKDCFKDDEPIKFALDSLWVNFQRKTEYNPLHDHTGIFSFVSWINIPYDVTEELQQPHVVQSNSPVASSFNFIYTNIFGGIQNLPLFPEKINEGDIIFFPSELNHLVYPFFTSNDYRITVSGNLIVKK